MKAFFWVILRPILQERGRTLITLLGVAIGIAMLLGIRKANEASLAGFRAGLELTSGKASLEILCEPLGVDETLIKDLTWLRQWGIMTAVMQADVWVENADGTGAMVPLLGVDALRDPSLRDYAVKVETDASKRGTTDELAGMDLFAYLGAGDQVILTEALATSLRVTEGETLTLVFGDRQQTLQVARVLAADGMTAGASGRLLVMDIAAAQVALEREGRVDRLELRLHDETDIVRAEAAIAARLPEGLTLQRPARRGEAVEKMLAAFHFNLTMLSSIALVVGLFLVFNTVAVGVMRRRSEIGMLRTLGVTRWGICRLFLGEALFFGVLGGLVGVLLGQGLAMAAVKLTAATVDALYVTHAARVPGLESWDLALGLGVAVPLALLAALWPVLEAVKVPPVAAVREGARTGLTEADGGRRWMLVSVAGALLCLLGGWWACQQEPVGELPLWGYLAAAMAVAGLAFFAPLGITLGAGALRSVSALGIIGRLAAGQVRASRRRLSVSVAALGVSMTLTLAIAIMVSSFRQTVELWVDQSMGADLYLRPSAPPRATHPPAFSREIVEELNSHPAIDAVDGFRALDVSYQGRMIKLGTGDFGLHIARTPVALKTRGDGKALVRRALEEDGVLVSEAFAMRFKVREGDVIRLSSGKGDVSLPVMAIFYDYSNDRGTVTMDHRLFERWFGESNPTHLAVYLNEGWDPENVAEELRAQLTDRRVMLFTNAALRAEVMRIFDATFAITWALELIAIAVAMGGVAATMITLLVERQDEMRLLRLAGAAISQVRKTVLLESALLGTVSQALGLVAGLLLSLVLIRVINPQSFGWSIQFHFPAGFVLGSSILTVLGTMLAGWLPARRMMSQWLRVAAGLAVLGSALPTMGQSTADTNWAEARAGYPITLPKDHGQHPDMKIEWWYYTGSLEADNGDLFGYQLTFFRIGAVKQPSVKSAWALRDVWMAHLAVTDVSGRQYFHAERLNRAGPGLAGAAMNDLHVWNEDWLARRLQNGDMQLVAEDRAFGLNLLLDASAGTYVEHGENGISQKGQTAGNASHYYSLVGIPTAGELRLGDRRIPVTGKSWMDHEFGSSFLEQGQQGWDWFSAHLDDGSALMVFRLRHEQGDEKARFAGTWISAEGDVRALSSDQIRLQPEREWISTETAGRYPLSWTLELPEIQLVLQARALLEQQEMVSTQMPGLHYWEGLMQFDGLIKGKPIQGRGYLEMTGYAGPSMSLWFGASPR